MNKPGDTMDMASKAAMRRVRRKLIPGTLSKSLAARLMENAVNQDRPYPIYIEQPDSRPVRLRDKKEGYILKADDQLTWRAEGHEWEIRIPSGFVYDGASNPPWLWSWTGIAPDGLHRKAALYHDFIYRFAGQLPRGSFFKDGKPLAHVWTRKQADKLFATVLRWCDVDAGKRRMMYLGVRVAAWRAWNKATGNLREVA